jgi:hypothetical protein
MQYEQAQWGKSTKGAKLLRKIMAKFAVVRADLAPDAFGPFFIGVGEPVASEEECRLLSQIVDGTMTENRATIVVGALSLEHPFYERSAFVEALAALVAPYPAEVASPSTFCVSLDWCIFLFAKLIMKGCGKQSA